MATKQKGRKKGGRPSRMVPAGVLLLLMGAAAALSAVYFQRGARVESPPPYEESHLASGSGSMPDIDRINRALYRCFYRHKVPEADIRFLSVQPRRLGDNGWEFTELLVACRNRKQMDQLAGAIETTLSSMDSAVKCRLTGRRESGVIYDIGFRGWPTHQLIFSVERPLPQAGKRPRIAIIVDDLGYDKAIAASFMELGLDLTLSILPHAPLTRSVAKKAAEKGFELLLHLPMEPKGYPSVQPGPGALLMEMSDSELAAVLASDLKQIPGVRGVNNHMGSVFAEDREKMGLVLRELKQRNLFYVDSRTSRGTAGFEMARELGVACARRNVFLDNDLDSHAIQIQIERLKGLARHSGSAVGIAHPFRETVEALRQSAAALSSEMEVVRVSRLVSMEK